MGSKSSKHRSRKSIQGNGKVLADRNLPTPEKNEQSAPLVDTEKQPLATVSSKETWLRSLKTYKSVQKTEFTILGNGSAGSAETKIIMLDISLSADSDYAERTDLIPIEANKKYVISTEAIGIAGTAGCAFFGISLFDKKNVFLGRRARWLNDFTGVKKKYTVTFKAPNDASMLRIIYRINIETLNKSVCEYKLLPLDQIKILQADATSEEGYDSLENINMPSQGKTNDNQLSIVYAVKNELEAAKAAQKLVFQKSGSPTTSIIVLNYNKGEYTFNCLSSILRNTEPGTYEVILVDNGSTEEESKKILTKLENVTVLAPSENLGFIRGNNYASKHAKGKYLLFLNNDTLVMKGWLDALLRTFERHDNVGVVGSKFIYPDGILQEAGSIIWQDGSGRGYGRTVDDPSRPEYQFVREVDYCSGASLIVRKDLFDEVGGFNEFYVPAYFEDVDLCFAARRKGYKVMYTPFSEVVHYEGITSTRDVHNPTGVKRFELENRPKFVSLWKEELENRLPALQANVLYARDLKKGPTVLVVDGWVPEPDKSSGDNRSYSITRILSQLGCRVTLYVSNFRQSKYANDLRELGIEVIPASYMPLDQFLQARSGYYSMAIVNTNRMSLTDAESCFYQIRIHNPGVKVALHIDDLYGYCKLIKKSILKDESDIATDEEVKKLLSEHALDLLEFSEFIFVISSREERIVNSLAGKKSVIIPEMRQLIAKERITNFDRRDDCIIYVGGFSHKPNLASAKILINDVFPKVKAKVPDAKLYIVGNVPPPEFTSIKDKNIIVTGFVEDLSKYYSIAKVSACPVVAKGGVKGKIIEALNYYTPVVTSPLGVEGTELVDGRDILIAKDSNDFANKIIELFQNKTLWEMLTINGREYFIKNNSTLAAEAVLNGLLKKIDLGSVNLGAADGLARKFQLEAPLALLKLLYSERADLQIAFPEAKDGQYARLIQWAAKDGVTSDSNKNILSPYKEWFAAKTASMSK